MLELRRAGSLSVARDILSAGQKEIFGDATALALYYISTPGTSPSELQPACWVIRDFGTDEQFSRFISEIRKSQYRDRHHYDELWRNTIWSDSKRERAVLEILLADQRIFTCPRRHPDFGHKRFQIDPASFTRMDPLVKLVEFVARLPARNVACIEMAIGVCLA